MPETIFEIQTKLGGGPCLSMNSAVKNAAANLKNLFPLKICRPVRIAAQRQQKNLCLVAPGIRAGALHRKIIPRRLAAVDALAVRGATVQVAVIKP